MGMDKAKASEAYDTCPIPGEIRKRNTLLIPYNDDLDRASSSDKNAQLTSCFEGDFRERTSDFLAYNLLGRDFSSVDRFDSFDLAGLQAD